MEPETVAWAVGEFGHAQLGDPRRTARLVAVAAKAAESPNGRLTEVFQDSAELEGAYRLIESSHVDDKSVGEAVYRATARRASSEALVLVPVDGSNITVPWAAGTEFIEGEGIFIAMDVRRARWRKILNLPHSTQRRSFSSAVML